jgi:DNA modification methylase
LVSTDVNDIILDPFIGAGSTAIACVKAGRKYVGYEIDRKYFDVARNRIQMMKRVGLIEKKTF